MLRKLFNRNQTTETAQETSTEESLSARLTINSPIYVRWPLILVGLVCFFYALYVMQGVLKPVVYGVLLAIMLNPIVNRLQRWGAPKWAALLLALLTALGLLSGIVYFLYAQTVNFMGMSSEFVERFQALSADTAQWIESKFGISQERQLATTREVLSDSQALIGSTINQSASFLGNLFLTFVYALMLLTYKPLFINFIYEIFGKNRKEEDRVSDIVFESKEAIQSFVGGLLIEMAIITALLFGAYWFIGIEYALLLAFLGALLNLIPYIGSFIGWALPVFIALVTKDEPQSAILWTTVLYILIQAVDKYVIVPNVVASKVSLNAFFTVFIVFLGNAYWGVSGMFLSIIILGLVKIVFDRISYLKPYGKLLGDDISKENLSIDERHTESMNYVK